MTQGKMTGRRGPVPVRCGTTAVGRAKARPKGDRTRATRSKQGVGLESPNPEKHRKSDETTDTSDVEGACFQGWETDAIHLSSTRTCPGNDQSIQLATNRRGIRTISAQKQPPVPGETSTERQHRHFQYSSYDGEKSRGAARDVAELATHSSTQHGRGKVTGRRVEVPVEQCN
jgi:hypothetical protein